MTAKQRAERAENIRAHGVKLQAIYPATRTMTPEALCKALHRIEARAARYALHVCNGDAPQYSEMEQERIEAGVLAAVNKILGTEGPRVMLNLDPRGYALKISDDDVRALNLDIHRDWGGYGIICPEF